MFCDSEVPEMFMKILGRQNSLNAAHQRTEATAQPGRLPLGVRWAAWRFSGERSEYYDYVASSLSAGSRHRSLLDLFQADAIRHPPRSARAVLSNWWASRYLASGANLGETFECTLPVEDVACLEMSRLAGQQALVQILQSMSNRGTALEECRRAFLQTVLAGVIAMATAMLVMTVFPLFTLKELLNAFSSVDPQQAGTATRSLIAWVHWLQSFGFCLPIVLAGATGWVVWSLRGWVGDTRDRFDGFGIWRLERDRQALQFLSLTATLIRNLGPHGVSLRAIVEMQLACAQPWIARHLMKMLAMMDLGADPLDAMNTGLLDVDSWARLNDVVLGYGLTQGFAQAGDRVQSLLVTRVNRQGATLRWLMLLLSALIVLLMGAWHASVMEELRQAMLLGLAGY